MVCRGVLCFFFFKQKTAYEMLRSLVGSEMCIRDRSTASRCIHLFDRKVDDIVYFFIFLCIIRLLIKYLSLIHI